jgi:hypothetical protein
MVIDWSIIILVGLVGGFLSVLYALKMIISLYTADKYMKASRSLQLNLNKTQRALRDLPQYPQEAMSLPADIGSIINMVQSDPSVLRQWGIDPSILKNPIIKGFADKFLTSFQQSKKPDTVVLGKEKVKITEDLFTD